jgi:hypothetical protein
MTYRVIDVINFIYRNLHLQTLEAALCKVKVAVDADRHHGDDQSQVTPLVASVKDNWNTTHHSLDVVLR